LTYGELTAYNAGRRLATHLDAEVISELAHHHRDLGSYLTEGERKVYLVIFEVDWWRWWWKGWSEAMEER
jgi:hypothetical protein